MMRTIKAMWYGTFKSRNELEHELSYLRAQVAVEKRRANMYKDSADSMARIIMSLDRTKVG